MDEQSLAGEKEVEATVLTVFTIGHSNHSLERFFELLETQRIEVLVDVRSQPYSKYTTHFNKADLKAAVVAQGLKYLFLGRELGGRPDPNSAGLYNETDGRVDYNQVAESPLFIEGLERLLKGLEKFRVALMCSEEKPGICHRYLLLGRVLARQGVQVWHIRGDGSVQSQSQVSNQAEGGDPDYIQNKLIPDEEITEWKSTRPVLPKKQRHNFSGH
ncbi:MAG: DUF488 domain-containing protein [Chloroflexota bacterium]|nr:DUF488 domain-containing protein [Chloroflexota bacterium]